MDEFTSSQDQAFNIVIDTGSDLASDNFTSDIFIPDQGLNGNNELYEDDSQAYTTDYQEEEFQTDLQPDFATGNIDDGSSLFGSDTSGAEEHNKDSNIYERETNILPVVENTRESADSSQRSESNDGMSAGNEEGSSFGGNDTGGTDGGRQTDSVPGVEEETGYEDQLESILESLGNIESNQNELYESLGTIKDSLSEYIMYKAQEDRVHTYYMQSTTGIVSMILGGLIVYFFIGRIR